ncbi:MAG: helix-turn-helix transcriptional regulator [Candidatus Solibacter sp.]
MERAGEKLKRARERLKLTYRDVERASQRIAQRRNLDEFAIALSRLADIEHKGTVPTVFRLYSLCAIYRLDLSEVLGWYGVPLEQLPSDALLNPLNETHVAAFTPFAKPPAPPAAGPEVDLNSTTFLGHLMRRWGKTGLIFLNGWDLRQHRYGFIGMEDLSMFPILRPGSLVLIDESRRRILSEGWTNEIDRPIYFLETRDGYRCGWCTSYDGEVLWQPHPSSNRKPERFSASDVDIIGQVTGVAMLLEAKKPRRARTAPIPATSQDL